MKNRPTVLIAIFGFGLVLAGCGSSEPTPADQETAKANFTKSMTKEEAEAAGVGGAAAPPAGKPTK